GHGRHAAPRIAVRAMEGNCADLAAFARARGRSTYPGADHDRGHPGRGAVADPDRVGRRGAGDSRVLHARSPEHGTGGLVHVALEPEPARGTSVFVRRRLPLRHATVTWPV